jgi:hypothetical protein
LREETAVYAVSSHIAGAWSIDVWRSLPVAALLVAAASCARHPPLQFDPSALTCRAIVPDAAPSLTWMHPTDSRSRDAVPRWCATIGPVFFDANPPGQNVNTWLGDREPAIASLQRAFSDTPRWTSCSTWRGPLGIRAGLDRVFVRGSVRSVAIRRLPDRFGSDHSPLLARLTF